MSPGRSVYEPIKIPDKLHQTSGNLLKEYIEPDDYHRVMQLRDAQCLGSRNVKLAKLLRGEVALNKERPPQASFEHVIQKQKKRYQLEHAAWLEGAIPSLEDKILNGDFKPRRYNRETREFY